MRVKQYMRNSMRQPVTEEEIRKYADRCGKSSAVGLLLLYGPDMFAGDYEDYQNLMKELEEKE